MEVNRAISMKWGGPYLRPLYHGFFPGRKGGSLGENLQRKVRWVGGKSLGQVLERGINETAELCNLRKERFWGRGGS